jgi:hypothetical protein
MTTRWNELSHTDRAVLAGHGAEQVVVVRPTMVWALSSDTTAAIFLSQMLYWAARTKEQDGWFFNTIESLEDQLGIAYQAQARCRKLLEKMGLIGCAPQSLDPYQP